MSANVTKASDEVPTIWDTKLLAAFAAGDALRARWLGISVEEYRAMVEQHARTCSECGRPYDDD